MLAVVGQLAQQVLLLGLLVLQEADAVVGQLLDYVVVLEKLLLFGARLLGLAGAHLFVSSWC